MNRIRLLLFEISSVLVIHVHVDHKSNEKWSKLRGVLEMMKLTLYVDKTYSISQLASSYMNITCLEIVFIVNVPVYTFYIYIVE